MITVVKKTYTHIYVYAHTHAIAKSRIPKCPCGNKRRQSSFILFKGRISENKHVTHYYYFMGNMHFVQSAQTWDNSASFRNVKPSRLATIVEAVLFAASKYFNDFSTLLPLSFVRKVVVVIRHFII